MRIRDYKTLLFQELSSLYDEKEIESFFYLVLENIHQKKRIDLALSPEMEMDAAQVLQWDGILAALKQQQPIQYLLGKTLFYGLPFVVNGSVLIPRPETEELVDLIIEDCRAIPKTTALSILDIGTGSGCIPIALKKNLPHAEVHAIDVSEEALTTARKNAELNNVNVTFSLKDILKIKDLELQFDVIVSNPPYVRHLEKIDMNPNVLEYEPHLALFVEDDDALVFYRAIAHLAQKSLTANGKLYFEINQYLGNETVKLLQSSGFKDVSLHKDVFGNDRMISCYYS